MSFKHSVAIFAFVASLMLAPAGAYASCPVQSDGVALGYESEYVVQGSTYTHRGVDVSADPGSEIVAPCSGTVSFCGAVPASDTSDGLTMLAVSIEMQDGRIVTLMPCEDIVVAEGQQLCEGDLVASLAGSGDRSSSQSHLHVGLKSDGIYEDPSWLLGIVSAGGEPETSDNQGNLALGASVGQAGETAVAGAASSASATGALASDALVASSEAGQAALSDAGVASDAAASLQSGAEQVQKVSSGGVETLPAASSQIFAALEGKKTGSGLGNEVGALFGDIAQAVSRLPSWVVAACACCLVALAGFSAARGRALRLRRNGGNSASMQCKEALAGKAARHVACRRGLGQSMAFAAAGKRGKTSAGVRSTGKKPGRGVFPCRSENRLLEWFGHSLLQG